MLQSGEERGFQILMDVSKVVYEMQTHRGFYSQFYAKFPDLDDGGLMDFVSGKP